MAAGRMRHAGRTVLSLLLLLPAGGLSGSAAAAGQGCSWQIRPAAQTSGGSALEGIEGASSHDLWAVGQDYSGGDSAHFPAHALLIVEERLAEQEAEGVRIPAGLDRTELALKILVMAAVTTPRNIHRRDNASGHDQASRTA